MATLTEARQSLAQTESTLSQQEQQLSQQQSQIEKQQFPAQTIRFQQEVIRKQPRAWIGRTTQQKGKFAEQKRTSLFNIFGEQQKIKTYRKEVVEPFKEEIRKQEEAERRASLYAYAMRVYLGQETENPDQRLSTLPKDIRTNAQQDAENIERSQSNVSRLSGELAVRSELTLQTKELGLVPVYTDGSKTLTGFRNTTTKQSIGLDTAFQTNPELIPAMEKSGYTFTKSEVSVPTQDYSLNQSIFGMSKYTPQSKTITERIGSKLIDVYKDPTKIITETRPYKDIYIWGSSVKTAPEMQQQTNTFIESTGVSKLKQAPSFFGESLKFGVFAGVEKITGLARTGLEKAPEKLEKRDDWLGRNLSKKESVTGLGFSVASTTSGLGKVVLGFVPTTPVEAGVAYAGYKVLGTSFELFPRTTSSVLTGVGGYQMITGESQEQKIAGGLMFAGGLYSGYKFETKLKLETYTIRKPQVKVSSKGEKSIVFKTISPTQEEQIVSLPYETKTFDILRKSGKITQVTRQYQQDVSWATKEFTPFEFVPKPKYVGTTQGLKIQFGLQGRKVKKIGRKEALKQYKDVLGELQTQHKISEKEAKDILRYSPAKAEIIYSVGKGGRLFTSPDSSPHVKITEDLFRVPLKTTSSFKTRYGVNTYIQSGKGGLDIVSSKKLPTEKLLSKEFSKVITSNYKPTQTYQIKAELLSDSSIEKALRNPKIIKNPKNYQKLLYAKQELEAGVSPKSWLEIKTSKKGDIFYDVKLLQTEKRATMVFGDKGEIIARELFVPSKVFGKKAQITFEGLSELEGQMPPSDRKFISTSKVRQEAREVILSGKDKGQLGITESFSKQTSKSSGIRIKTTYEPTMDERMLKKTTYIYKGKKPAQISLSGAEGESEVLVRTKTKYVDVSKYPEVLKIKPKQFEDVAPLLKRGVVKGNVNYPEGEYNIRYQPRKGVASLRQKGKGTFDIYRRGETLPKGFIFGEERPAVKKWNLMEETKPRKLGARPIPKIFPEGEMGGGGEDMFTPSTQTYQEMTTELTRLQLPTPSGFNGIGLRQQPVVSNIKSVQLKGYFYPLKFEGTTKTESRVVSIPSVIPIIIPKVTPIVKPMVIPIVKPIITPRVTPIVKPIVIPIVKPITTPIVIPVVKPFVFPIIKPIATGVKFPKEKPYKNKPFLFSKRKKTSSIVKRTGIIRQPTGYMPSFTARAFSIYGKKPRKIAGGYGFGLRPIVNIKI